MPWNPVQTPTPNTDHKVPKEIAEEAAREAAEEAWKKALAALGIHLGSGNGAAPSADKPRLESIIPGTVNINFEDAPVGGWSSLSLWPDGRYQFSGHLHDSGGPSYDYSVVWVVSSSAGTAFLFTRSGHLHGTFEHGSRDDDWSESAPNGAFANAWSDLSRGYQWECRAAVDSDLQQLVDALTKSANAAAKVITIVASA